MGMGAISALGDNDMSIFTRIMVFTGPTILVAVLLGLLFGTLANVFTSSVWTLAYREWNKPAQPAETALQPVAPPIEPIPPIEPPASSNSPTLEPTPEDKA
jgi:hypothetical protein